MSSIQDKIWDKIIAERIRQDKLHGEMPQRNDPIIWLTVLAEKLGEIADELEVKGDDELKDLVAIVGLAGSIARNCMKRRGSAAFQETKALIKSPNYLTEIAQLAAVCVAALEDFELSGSAKPIDKTSPEAKLTFSGKTIAAKSEPVRAINFLVNREDIKDIREGQEVEVEINSIKIQCEVMNYEHDEFNKEEAWLQLVLPASVSLIVPQ